MWGPRALVAQLMSRLALVGLLSLPHALPAPCDPMCASTPHAWCEKAGERVVTVISGTSIDIETQHAANTEQQASSKQKTTEYSIRLYRLTERAHPAHPPLQNPSVEVANPYSLYFIIAQIRTISLLRSSVSANR